MSMYIRRLLSLPPLCLLMLLLLASFAAPAFASQYNLNATADPTRVAYNETQINRTTIRVNVYLQGRPAPDLTPVHFTTTLGTMPTLANTQGGQVIVPLENYQQGPGNAMVTIQAGDAQQTLIIEFFGQGGAKTAISQKRLRYQVRARQVYYSTEQQVFDVPYDGEFVTPGFSVKAGALQYSLRQQLLTAQRDVVVTVGKTTIKAEFLRYDVGMRKGVLLEMDEKTLQTTYRTINDAKFSLSEVKDTEKPHYRDSFLPQKATPTRYWIISRQATIYPGQELHFKRAEFYLNGANFCFIRLPYHVLFLNEPSDNMFLSGTMSLTSDGGLDADFPVYYAADDAHIGSIHFRNVTPGSALYRGVSGPQVGVEEEFHVGTSGDGTLFFDDLTRDTRSVIWSENQAFGRLHTSFGASYNRYSATSPYTTSSFVNMSRPFGKYSASLSTNWSMYNGTQTGLAEMSLTPPSVKLGRSGLAFNTNPFVGWQLQQSAATTTTPQVTTTNLYQGVRNSLSFPNYPFLKGAFAPSISDEISHDQTGKLTNYFDTGLRYQHTIGKFSSSLGYTFDLQTSNKDTVAQVPTQRLSFDLFGNQPSWQFYGNSSYDLNSKTSYSSANLRYYLPWNRGKDHHPRWFVEYTGSVNLIPQTPLVADHLLSLGRSLGTYALVVHYSPSGNTAVTGIGTGTGKHWSLELVRSTW